MPVHNANLLIKQARIKAGLTQEQLSKDICTPQALSRIETGTANVSPATFWALMNCAGAPCGCFPAFNSRDGFECFYGLKRARFHLDAWQLRPAYEELAKVEESEWVHNKLCYQEWLLLHCKLQFRSCLCPHQRNYDALADALHMTRPDIDLSNFHELLLSQNEIQILTMLALEAISLNMAELALQIYKQIDACLADGCFAVIEKERMQMENAIVYIKYLMGMGDYSAALEKSIAYRKCAIANAYDALLLELTFLAGLCYHYLGETELADICFQAVFYSAQAIESCYASWCRDYLADKTDYPVTDDMKEFSAVPLTAYPFKDFQDFAHMTDGLYEADAASSYTLSDLIRDMRLEQKVGQQVLCRGLCSKSKLSKIENKSLQPDIALTIALLQRLGISGKILPFWGNKKDAEYYDLHFKVTHHQNARGEEITDSLDKIERLLDKGDVLYRQEYLSSRAFQSDSPEERIRALTEALQLTLPDFDIHKICDYRLTCEELSILNNIAHEYRRTENSHLCSLYFQQILAYARHARPDVLLQAAFLPITGFLYCHSLYTLKLYKEAVALPAVLDMDIMRYFVKGYGRFLFCYSRALGERHCRDEAKTAAMQSYAINVLMGL